MAKNVKKKMLKALIAREAVKMMLRPMLRWAPLTSPEPGFSIILGVPWDLRHLLPVNLKFIAVTDTSDLRRIHVVFDRCYRPQMQEIEASARHRFSSLPLTFHHYDSLAGRLIEKVNVSTFYNSMNCATALRQITTRYAVLHDFDLFPVVPRYFNEIVSRMAERQWRFCGLERTYFDGLTDEDNILGTWALGMDVQWLRSEYHPVDIFHKVEPVRGQWTTLDPFSAIQRRTTERGLVETIDRAACCHVGNLCATYMRYRSGEKVRFTWKLHYLWYLEALDGRDRLDTIRSTMDQAEDGHLKLDDFEGDFSQVDPTCANVLGVQLEQMDSMLFGEYRPHVRAYVEAFGSFLSRGRSLVTAEGAAA